MPRRYWKAAGLLRLAKVSTVDEQLIDKTIGRLSTSDLEAARKAGCSDLR